MEYKRITTESLDNYEILDIKFLLGDLFSPEELDKVVTSWDLVRLLSGTYIHDYNILALLELLLCIGRNDILEKLNFKEKDIELKRKMYLSYMSPFRVFLYGISRELTSAELGQIKLSSCVPTLDFTNPSALDFFTELIQRGFMKEDDLSFLSEAFEEIKRSDLVKKIKKYKKTPTKYRLISWDPEYIHSIYIYVPSRDKRDAEELEKIDRKRMKKKKMFSCGVL